MCLKWRSLWTVVQILWSTFYVIGGVIQLTAGIFFSLSVPNLSFHNIICTGIWNIFMGIVTGMVACIVLLSPKRQEILLYMSISILVVNFVNLLIMEYRFYIIETLKIFSSDNSLLNYASIITRIASSIILIVAFLNSQVTFCSVQILDKNRNFNNKQEHLMDIEYIIPKKQNPKRKTSNLYDGHAQSWVFESEHAGSSRNTSLKHHQDRIITKKVGTVPFIQNYSAEENGNITSKSILQMEDTTDYKTNNSNLKQCHLKSFSRSPSPFVLSASSSQLNINMDEAYNNPPIYEYLEKLTEPSIYQSRLDMALCNRNDEENVQYQVPVIKRRAETTEACIEKMQYVCLMEELQRALTNKTDNAPSLETQSSDSSSTSEKSKRRDLSDDIDSDDDISLQLEAALQLIQDLESPDTPEMPKIKISESDPNMS